MINSRIEVIDYIKHIYPQMFFDTNFVEQNIIIPEHIKTIQQIAYMCSNINSVVINDNIEEIAGGAQSVKVEVSENIAQL